jgi:hypothetical protein
VAQFETGGGGLLELARLDAGAPPPAEPTGRRQVNVAAVFLTTNLNQAIENALLAGGRKLETLPLPTAMVTYVADPEGNVIGFRQNAPEPDLLVEQDAVEPPSGNGRHPAP